MIRTRSLLLVVLACTLAVPAAAHASFPGKNGPLVVALADDCQSFGRYLARIPWRGGEPVSITERCDPAGGDDPAQQAPNYLTPDAAPDGRSVLAVRNGTDADPGFVTLAPDGTGLAPVTMPAGVPAHGLGSMPPPSFAPNGRKFAFEADHHQNGYDVEPLWEVQLDGSGFRQIRKAPECGGGKTCSIFENPRWSPDGKLIAVEVITYRPEKSGALKPGIWLIRARDGKPVRRLAKHGFDVDWSPNGRNIVYRTHYQQREVEGGASGGNLYVVSRDGKRRRTLVHRHDIAETQPTWSPDGRWITWVSLDFTGGDVGFDVFPSLWTIRVSGGRPKRIQELPEPYVEEGMYSAPHLTWLPAS